MATIVIELPATLKPLEGPIRTLIEGMMEVHADLHSRTQAYGEVELAIGGLCAGVERSCHEALLSSLAPDTDSIRVGGRLYQRVTQGTGSFQTMAGEVRFLRWLYRAVGVRNGPTIDPIAVRVGAIRGSWLPATASAMAHAVQMTTSREAAAQAALQQRLVYSRSSYEDVAHDVGRLIVEHLDDVDDAVIGEVEVPQGAHSLTVSVDRVSIPMEEPRKRPPGRPKKGAPTRPVSVVWRMAYCATISINDSGGEVLRTLRYARMPGGDAEGMLRGMAVDVGELLQQRPSMHVVCLADGAPEMWGLLEQAINKEVLDVKRVILLVDFWHLTEKLAAAARVLPGDPSVRLTRWKLSLVNRTGAPAQIIQELKASGLEWSRVGDQCPVHNAITYLENQADRLRYPLARRLKLPIGSGPVEATCKSVVGIRMKRPGSRWKHETGDQILQARVRALSDAWKTTAQVALKPLRRRVEAA